MMSYNTPRAMSLNSLQNTFLDLRAFNMLKSVFLALFLVIIVVFGQDAPAPGASKSKNSSKPARKQDRNGCFSFRACGKEGVLRK